MSPIMLFLLIVTGIALYLSTSDERRRFLRAGVELARRASGSLHHFRPARGEFDAALRARTPWLLVTPALAVGTLTIFTARLFGSGSLDDAAALTQWGANFGPLTANGEWWRLLSAGFLHDNAFMLILAVAAIAQLGPVLERQLGHVTYAAVYLAAATFGSLMNLAAYPESVTTSGAAAIFGLYGLLAASIVRGLLRRSEVSMPLSSIAVLLPLAAIFTLSVAGGGSFDLSDKAGLFTGFVSGLVVARDVRHRKPTLPRVAMVTTAALAIAAIAAVPLRGVTDIRPELDVLIAVEARTAAAYDAAVRRFHAGRNTARAMVELIEQSILPDIEAARARIGALRRVPRAHQPLVAAAGDYLRLRDESWRLRVEALGKANMRLLREADKTERASLAAFEQIKAAATAAPGS